MEANGSCRSVVPGVLMLSMAVVFGVAPALAQAPAAKKESAAATNPVDAKATAKAERVRTDEPAAEPPGGPQEGIKVHGHWVIEVRNPDGTLVTHREFENSLISSGKQTLASILARQATPGTWGITILDPLCGPSRCQIAESSVTGAGIISNLTVSSSSDSIVLNGNFTAASAGSVTSLTTSLGLCPSSTATGACVAVPSNDFTNRNLGSPGVAVQAGQIVQVTVTISFS